MDARSVGAPDDLSVTALLADAVRRGRAPRLYAAPEAAPRSRRPTDIVLAVSSAVVVLVLALAADQPEDGVAAAGSELLAALPGLLDPLWWLVTSGLLVWAATLAVLAAVRRRWGLARDQLMAATGVVAAGVVLTRVSTGEWPDLPDAALGIGGPHDYPLLSLALSVAVISVAAPHLARPFRYLGRWLATAGAVGAVALGVASVTATIGGVAVGLATAAVVHLAVGSPGGRPSLRQVGLGLADLGVAATPVGSVDSRDGVAVVGAVGPAGEPLLVRVYGRDAWDGQLLATLWRFAVYRDGASAPALTRMQQVEHEAVLTLLAEQRGAPVSPVVAVGRATDGDALLVVRRLGEPVEPGSPVDDGLLAGWWAALERLHRAGIVHGRLDHDALLHGPHGARLGGLRTARVIGDRSGVPVDHAQLLAATAAMVGADRAVAAAVRALGADGLAPAISYVQPAALPGGVRRALDEADLDVDDLRDTASAACGVDPPDLPKLRRVTWGSVATGVLLFIAFSALIGNLVDIGFDTIVDALRDARWSIVLVAFVLGQLPRLANAAAVLAASPIPIPFGRVAVMQFAITFVNLAMPSTAGRVAVNVRFFRRSGVPAGAAVAIGALDSVSGFAAQILLIATILLLGLGSLDLGIDDSIDLGAILPLVLLVGGLVVLGVTVVAVVPSLRRRVLDAVRPALAPLDALRSPARLLRLFGANLLAELLFALAMYTVLRAYGQDVSYADVVLINEAVALFAGLVPVPGGIGVTEAALTAGFVAAGVPDATAFAAALTYRLVTYYTPPLLGFPALRWLQRNRFL